MSIDISFLIHNAVHEVLRRKVAVNGFGGKRDVKYWKTKIHKEYAKPCVELWDLQTRMCLQNLIQYGESIDQVAISQAQNHKSG